MTTKSTKSNHVIKAYVIGFNKEWANANEDLCRKLIAECDFCIDAPKGVAIGERLDTEIILEGSDDYSVPKLVLCTGHEYGGKVVLLKALRD